MSTNGSALDWKAEARRGAGRPNASTAISAILFGVGFLLIVVRRDNRGLHDLIARTAVVYDWGDRAT